MKIMVRTGQADDWKADGIEGSRPDASGRSGDGKGEWSVATGWLCLL